ncbi:MULTISPECIES: helix-turn-helix transcriptional regulator [unclassified Frondihabitans]|uniref:helix-turn-helix transcriptional regulator n=1 Tax=unclassified Frondihabitans TaxID=2626248 RepID=UPI0006FFF655|nr:MULTISPECIES: LuxR C-terminal-related transcriptional regulator [unclassified Frondihabitans]KQQ28148.1 hypothetical protein ASF54_05450 [Frondihabitans sp. Leaf304]RPE78917.1 regulatory LuxR family protein [Frondihabitans sp. PhB153]RPF09198.1 regulatory LuxR family protein [Frondihabitans sp. PhB161]
MNSRNDTTVEPETSTALQLDNRTMLDTVERMWPQIAPIQGARLREAVRSVPESEWRGRARILLALAVSHRSIGSTSRSAALPWFRAVDKNIKADPESPIDVRAGYLVHFAATLRTLGDVNAARTHLETARAMIEQDTSLEISRRIDLSASFSLQLGLVRVHLGAYDEALFALSLAEGLASEHLPTAERVECHSALAYVAFQFGDFARAERQIELAAQQADGTELLRSGFGALAQITRFHLLIERDAVPHDLETQLRDVRVASRGTEWEAHAAFAEALARHAAGSEIEALDLLGRVTRLLASFTGDQVLDSASRILRSEVLRTLGEVVEARQAMADLEPGQHHVTCPARVGALASFLLGDPQAALDTLADCIALGDLHSDRVRAQIFAIVAAAQDDLGNRVASNIAFDRSLLMSATNGTTWAYRPLPHEVLDSLLTRAADREQPARVAALLERLQGTTPAETVVLADPLSERELVIVRHLATGATLNQIGNELFISVNTVKSHVRSIYRKLGATNRREAIALAVQLGLADG